MSQPPLDLDDIEARYLTQCGPHDYGLGDMGCNCPENTDPRPVVSQLVTEVRALRQEIADLKHQVKAVAIARSLNSAKQ